MSAYRWHEHEFVEQVAARHGCRIEHGRGSPTWTLHGNALPGGVPWRCVLTTAHNETDASVEWTTPAVTAGQPPFEFGLGHGSSHGDDGVLSGTGLGAAATIVAGLGVISWLRNRSARGGRPPAPSHPLLGPGWWVHDPNGVLDADLAGLLLSAPAAWRGPGKTAPALVERLSLNHDHLVVGSSHWWASAEALEHHLEVGQRAARAIVARRS